MLVQKFTPAIPLRKLIRCYYYLEKNDHGVLHDRFFADGCVEVVFSIGWDFFKQGEKEHWAKIIGQIVEPRELEIRGSGRSFGIWFYPHAFSFFTGLNISELNDTTLPWESLFPKSFSEMIGHHLAYKQPELLIQETDRFWLKQLSVHKERASDSLLEYSINYLQNQKSEAGLKELSDILNVTPRYLQKVFIARTGLTQKQLLRIFRFQDVMNRLGSTRTSLTRLAYDAGYYDQSHFIRDFKSFTGVSPSGFDTNQLPINQHFIAGEM